jgi:hypothetical protein
LESWSAGVLEYWSTGVLESWSVGVLEHWSAGVLEKWSIGEMGKFVKYDDELVYQQDDGEITARLIGFEEKMELPHEGSAGYKKVFYLLVFISVIYLLAVFIFL